MATKEEQYLAAGDRLESLVQKFGNYKELDKDFVKIVDEDMMKMYVVLACQAEGIPHVLVEALSGALIHVISRAMTFGYYLAITNGHES